MCKQIFTIKFWQACLLIVFAAVVFYAVFPKYQSFGKYRYHIRFNKITGSTELLENGKWEVVPTFHKSAPKEAAAPTVDLCTIKPIEGKATPVKVDLSVIEPIEPTTDEK